MTMPPSSKPDIYLRSLVRDDRQVILSTEGILCATTEELVNSRAFETVLGFYLDDLERHASPILARMAPDVTAPGGRRRLLSLLRNLSETRLENAARVAADGDHYLNDRRALHLFIEGFYDFWRAHDRYLICTSEQGPNSHDRRPYRTFNITVERLKHLVRALYRDICENITGDRLRIYRQVSAGCDVGIIAVQRQWPSTVGTVAGLDNIPFVRQVLINPPLIIDPPENRRTGEFLKVETNPLENLDLDPEQWLCYPAQVGPVVIFIYFNRRFMGLGCSLANLFELATDEQIASGPEAIYLYGVPSDQLGRYGDLPTVFFDDEANDLLIAAVPGEDRFGYFGYLKKMALTLHNVRVMKRGRMPFHGAMTRITLRNGRTASLLIMGDTATGKSETLEALRTLGRDSISDMTIVADDMGSLEIGSDGRVHGYGTEIGAFIRLDDLAREYAFNQVDRAIIMSPQKVNARVVVPVAFLEEVTAGYPVDYVLYTNNYEQVDPDHPIVDPLPTPQAALRVFREGAAMAKGTTTSIGLVHSYFANIFGPPQYRDMHEELAVRTFEAAFSSGAFFAQIRTRLALPGFEIEGPREAAHALFELISRDRS
ncbi:MAG: phosphoenolpyruvate carboxykinase [bacterium]|nr:MAG: phosphoenolpyruvate carboxykinase [bacterium]